MRVLACRGHFPSFLEMHFLEDCDITLESVALISFLECISRALAPLGSFGRASVLLGSQLLWFPLPLSLLLLLCPGFSGTALVLLGSWILWVPPHPRCGLLFCPGFSDAAFFSFRLPASLFPPHTLCVFAFLSWLLWDSFCFLGSRLLRAILPYCVL